MVKLKFVLMLLVLTLIAFGGWGYTAYQLQVVQNNHNEVVAENTGMIEELKKIHAQQEDDRRSWEEFNAAAQAEHERIFRGNSNSTNNAQSNVDPSRYSLNGMAERRQQRRLEQEKRERENQGKD